LREVCEAAGLPLLNITARRSYSVEELRREVGAVAPLPPTTTTPERPDDESGEPGAIVTDLRPD
ncbi:MAG: hypothetical protein ACOC48_03920, partial [Thiohalospira sp.]